MQKTKQYIQIIGKLIKQIEKAEPVDRLEYATATAFLLSALNSSIGGWGHWMKSLEYINSLTMKDWKETYPKMAKLTIEWLKVDLNITKKKVKDATIKFKKFKKKLRKRTRVKKTTYVA